MSVIAIVQARLGSTRLPRKVLAPIAGAPMLSWVLRRAKQMKTVDEVVLAVPMEDGELLSWAAYEGVAGYAVAGDPNDVLSRYVEVAKSLGLGGNDRIVRITGDCPGLDPLVSDSVVNLSEGADFTANTRDWPDGLDTEVFTMRLLMSAASLTPSEDREHVTLWMRQHAADWEELPLHHSPQRQYKWSVDTSEDLERVRGIYATYGPDWGWRDGVQFIDMVYCPDQPPCLLCDKGFGHLNRAGQMIWDLHEIPLATGGRIFEECAMPHAALNRAIARGLGDVPVITP